MIRNNRPRAPLLVTVNVTGHCNLSCRYCYFQPRGRRHMTAKDFAATLATLKRHDIFLLTLSGGEPFLHPRISSFLELAHEMFDHVSVLTNGTAFKRSHFDTIRRIVNKKQFFPIQVSLDSVDAEVNELSRGQTTTVLKNLERLKECGANLTIATVLSSRNIDSLATTIGSLVDLTRHFHVMPIKPVPFLEGSDADLQVSSERLDRAWRELAELREKHGIRVRTPIDDLCSRVETSATGAPCMAGFTKLAIDPNLNVRPCDKCVGAVVGSLREETLEDIWNGPRMEHIFRRPHSYCVSNAPVSFGTASRIEGEARAAGSA